jgi:4'-phosphopantetheinyl transferase
MPSGAPEAFVPAGRAPLSISLTHRAGVGVCVVGPAGAALGCDAEVIEPRSDAFAADYFTAGEQLTIARTPLPGRPRLLALLWSGKESALKALRAGLRLDTRSVVLDPVDTVCPQNTWLPLLVRYDAARQFHGWWRYEGDLLLTALADPRPAPPILLEAPDRRLSVRDRMLLQPVRIPHRVDVPQCATSHTACENP